MTESVNADKLRRAIAERNARRGLCLDRERLAYHTGYFAPWLEGHGRRILVVGVGHGLDALNLLAEGIADSVVGVDPYVGDHGNDDEDYAELVKLISELGLAERFGVERTTIQEFLSDSPEPFSAVLCFDVLHHIFVTRKPLSESPLFKDAKTLFSDLRDAATPGAVLVMGETEPRGLRQTLTKTGLLKGQVDYATKQSFSQWRKAARAGGWKLAQRKVYIPYALRSLRVITNNPLGLATVSDRSLSLFQKTS